MDLSPDSPEERKAGVLLLSSGKCGDIHASVGRDALYKKLFY